MMKYSTQIVIDAEFNDFRGALISLACVAYSGQEFYEVLHCQSPAPWVAANVMPILGQEAVTPRELSTVLSRYLSQFDACNIIADWPEDVSHFCNAMITGPGQRIATPPLTFTLVSGYADTCDTSAIPHNALEDARALMVSIKTNRRKQRDLLNMETLACSSAYGLCE